jgi:hypothetical protein
MHLHRVTPTWDWANPDGVYLGEDCKGFRATKSRFVGDNQDWFVVANFPRFGGGGKRQSDYDVGVKWEDVETIIEKFCDVGHPQAIAVQEALKLANAAKKLGWHPPESASPQSN